MQVGVNGIAAGAEMALFAVAFSLVLNIRKFFDISLALPAIVAPYIGLALTAEVAIPVWLSAAVGTSLAVVVSFLLHSQVYSRLKQKGSRGLVLFLASYAIYVFGENAIALVFGGSAHAFPGTLHTFAVGGIRIGSGQLAFIIAAAVVTGGTHVLLTHTVLGYKLQAIADSAELATLSGIRVSVLELAAACLGALAAAVAGLIAGFQDVITPTMAMAPLFMGIVAAIAVRGLIVPACGMALLLGIVMEYSGWAFGLQWQEAGVFVLLLGVIVVISRKTSERTT